jgi:hypothetical protein
MADKKQKRAKIRAARLAQRDHVMAKQKAEIEDLQEEELPDEVIPEEEPLEKDMGMDMYIGPTSFGELDELKAAQEQAAQVRQVTWDTQDLVWNILRNPMIEPSEKAQKIQAVGSEFGARVSKAAKPIKKDLDVLVIESILAADKRHTGVFERVGDMVSKAVLTSIAENSLDDSQFALVKTLDGKKIREYLIHDKAHVRNALARAAQMLEKGGEVAAAAKAALPNIRAAAKKMGIEMSMEKDKDSIMIEKDANGDWRWVGWVSNNYIDWDGDILSKEAHEEYIAWLDANPDMAPVSTTWHMPELVRKNVTDFWAYEKGFLIMSGKLTEEEAEGLLKAKILTGLGMSHQSLALARDVNDKRIVTKYRMYENSDLPLENAANPFTNFEVISKEVDMDKLKYLAQYIGEDKAKAFLEKAGLKKEALDAAGIESKEKQEKTPTVPATPESPATTVVNVAAPADASAIIEKLKKELGMEELNEMLTGLVETAEKVPLLEGLLKEVLSKQEDKLAEILTPPAERYVWMQKNRASQSDATVLKKDDAEDNKLKERKPNVGWLSEVTNTEPVQV